MRGACHRSILLDRSLVLRCLFRMKYMYIYIYKMVSAYYKKKSIMLFTSTQEEDVIYVFHHSSFAPKDLSLASSLS